MPGRTWFIALAVLTGCLRPNPAFERPATGADSTGEAGSGDPLTGDPTATTGVALTTGEDPTGGERCRFDADCADDLFCNGVERCAPDAPDADPAGCIPGSDPCGPDTTCQELGDRCLTPCELDPDRDDDGVDGVGCGGLDCDDDDPAIFPGQTEVCDAQGVDEDCDPATLGTLDADGDGLQASECCNLEQGALVCGVDCDDSLPGLGVGDWAHCAACDAPCGAQQACEAGACVDGRRRVFATSTVHRGKLDGLAGADAICQARAAAAELGGVFKAYMVDNNTGLDRLEHPAVPFVRLDGVRIADDWNDLADESLDATLSVDEFRQPVGGNAWTGLRDVDGGGISSCNNWSFAGGECLKNGICGGAGETNMANDHWDGFYIFDCNSEFRLYCVEQ